MRFFSADGRDEEVGAWDASDAGDFGYLPFHACWEGAEFTRVADAVLRVFARVRYSHATSDLLIELARAIETELKADGVKLPDRWPDGVVAICFDATTQACVPWVRAGELAKRGWS